ncbi:MAG: phosphoglycerate dehydrogenase [Candidatus Helarchaeota archaeon]
MGIRILLTTTSFQDTPGKHHDLLKKCRYDIERLRGPLKKEVLIPIISGFDGIICGDDEITEEVISRGKKGRLKVISKYGVGLDRINLESAKRYGIPVLNTPGVNHITVAEHVIGLLLSFLKNIHTEYCLTKKGKWERKIGSELFGKKVGILGLGKIGKEVSKRLFSFGVKLYAYDIKINRDFIHKYQVKAKSSLQELLESVEILSINVPLNNSTRGLINKNIIQHHTRKGMIIINTARAQILDQDALIFGLDNGIIGGYLTDVMYEEPMTGNHPLIKYENVLITPHIGSRTYESVERQGILAVMNIKKVLG